MKKVIFNQDIMCKLKYSEVYEVEKEYSEPGLTSGGISHFYELKGIEGRFYTYRFKPYKYRKEKLERILKF